MRLGWTRLRRAAGEPPLTSLPGALGPVGVRGATATQASPSRQPDDAASQANTKNTDVTGMFCPPVQGPGVGLSSQEQLDKGRGPSTLDRGSAGPTQHNDFLGIGPIHYSSISQPCLKLPACLGGQSYAPALDPWHPYNHTRGKMGPHSHFTDRQTKAQGVFHGNLDGRGDPAAPAASRPGQPAPTRHQCPPEVTHSVGSRQEAEQVGGI